MNNRKVESKKKFEETTQMVVTRGRGVDWKKYKLPENMDINVQFLPVIHNLAALGFSTVEIGVILGCQAKYRNRWLFKRTGGRNQEISDAFKAGTEMADIVLVSQMYRAAVGYDYTETDVVYDVKLVGGSVVNGKLVGAKEIKVPREVREKKRHKPSDPQLMTLLAMNRNLGLEKVNTVLKKSINVNVEEVGSREQIEKLAGKLMEFNEDRERTSEVSDGDTEGSEGKS